MRTKLIPPPALVCCLVLCLVLSSALLSACVATGPRPGELPQGMAWPADPVAGQVYYAPQPMSGQAEALRALAALAPSLALPDTLESWVEFHLTKQVLVLALSWTGWEYQDVKRDPLYPASRGCRGGLDDDCPWPRTERVKAAGSKRLAVGLDEITAIRVYADNAVVLTFRTGSETLLAPDRGKALDLADALCTLAMQAGFHQEPGPAAQYRDLDPREAAALSTPELTLGSGVLVVSAPQGTVLGDAGLGHLDVVLALDGVPATAQALDALVDTTLNQARGGQAAKSRDQSTQQAIPQASSHQATVLRWTRLDARPWMETKVFTVALH